MMDVMLGMKLQESLSNRDESASSEDDDLVDVGPGAKRLRTARASACSISRRWRRMSSFDTVLPTGSLNEVLANHHPDILSKWWLPGGSTATWRKSHFSTLIFVEVSPFACSKCTTQIVHNLAEGSLPTCQTMFAMTELTMISFLQPNADASGARRIVATNGSSVVFVYITTRVRCVPLFTTAENNYCHVKHGQSCSAGRIPHL